jgi:hypothetical protein
MVVGVLDVSYAAPQVHGIVNVALHRQYSPHIIFIFSQRISIMSKTSTESNSNEYYTEVTLTGVNRHTH